MNVLLEIHVEVRTTQTVWTQTEDLPAFVKVATPITTLAGNAKVIDLFVNLSSCFHILSPAYKVRREGNVFSGPRSLPQPHRYKDGCVIPSVTLAFTQEDFLVLLTAVIGSTFCFQDWNMWTVAMGIKSFHPVGWKLINVCHKKKRAKILVSQKFGFMLVIMRRWGKINFHTT